MTLGGLVALTAQDVRHIDARVTELRPLGEFTAERAAHAVDDNDLNAFRLRLDPTGAPTGRSPESRSGCPLRHDIQFFTPRRLALRGGPDPAEVRHFRPSALLL